jgi:hypothetical protein
MCFVQGRLIVLPTKRKYFSLPLFGVYLIPFLSFSIILERLKTNKRMLCYQGGTSVANILSSKRKEHTDAQSKETCAGKGHAGKSLQGSRCQDVEEKMLQGLRMRHASDGSVEDNMEPALGQRHGDANSINKTQ